MNILVLGGTQFVGRAIVQEFLNRNHHVTIFHRGKTGADLFPTCNHILGDRNTDLAKADTQEWDAIVDVSCYLPDQARSAAKLHTQHYTFISTGSVYEFEGAEPPLNEQTKTSEGQEGTEVTGETYGPMKIRCEEIIKEAFPDRYGIVRLGIVVGPNDHTGRFPYWVSRFDRYEEVLVPDVLDQPMQWINTADLGEFVADIAEMKSVGTWNTVRPSLTFGTMIEEIRRQTGHTHELVMASIEQLNEMEVKFWADLPLTFGEEKTYPLFQFETKHAESAGLKHRSIEATVAAVLNWCRSDEFVENPKGGMTREREVDVVSTVKVKNEHP